MTIKLLTIICLFSIFSCDKKKNCDEYIGTYIQTVKNKKPILDTLEVKSDGANFYITQHYINKLTKYTSQIEKGKLSCNCDEEKGLLKAYTNLGSEYVVLRNDSLILRETRYLKIK